MRIFIYLCFLAGIKRINKRADVARAGQLLFICYLAANFANWNVCVFFLYLRCAVVVVNPDPDCSDLELRYVPDGESITSMLSLTPSFYLQKCWLWFCWNLN